MSAKILEWDDKPQTNKQTNKWINVSEMVGWPTESDISLVLFFNYVHLTFFLVLFLFICSAVLLLSLWSMYKKIACLNVGMEYDPKKCKMCFWITRDVALYKFTRNTSGLSLSLSLFLCQIHSSTPANWIVKMQCDNAYKASLKKNKDYTRWYI